MDRHGRPKNTQPRLPSFHVIRPKIRMTALLSALLLALPLRGQKTANQAENAIDGCAAAELKQGLVVESVAKNSEGEKAGLAEGDIILRWSRGDARGEIESAFDLTEIEIEQEPRGRVTLEGTRSGAKQIWVIGPDKWRIQARPSLPETLLAIYREAQELAKASKLSDAAERWRAAAAEGKKYQCSWLSSWFLLHAAEAMADARQWKESDALYQEAMEQTADAGPELKAQLLRAWAETFHQRGDLTNAEKYYQQAQVENQKSGSENLATVSNLNELGSTLRESGDLDKAEQNHRQALTIGEKLAPGSLAVATSLQDLGMDWHARRDLAKAEGYFHQALDIRKNLAPGSIALLSILNRLGNIAYDLSDLSKAEEYFRRALAIGENTTSGSPALLVTLNGLGDVAHERGELAQAQEYYRRALVLGKKSDVRNITRSLDGLGAVTYELGDLAKAEEYFNQALAISENADPGSLGIVRTLNSLGVVASDRGNLGNAEKYFQKALGISEELEPMGRRTAVCLDNLGSLAFDRGDLVKAEEYYRRALAIREKLKGKRFNVADSLFFLGKVAFNRNDLIDAEKYFREALAISENLNPGSLDVVRGANGLGSVYYELGNLAYAEEYFNQALAIIEKVAPGSFFHANSLENLGAVAVDRGNPVRAEEYYRQVLAINEKLAPGGLAVAGTLANIGGAALRHHDSAAAEEYYHRALLIWEKLAPESSSYAESLAALAAIARDNGQQETATQFFERALGVLDHQIALLGGSSDVRTSFRAKHAAYYSDYAELLLTQKQPELAFQVLERSRARTLLELVAEAHVDIRQGGNPSLLERERTLQVTLSAKSNRKISLLEGKHTEEQVAVFNKEIDELLSQYQEVEGQIRTSSPNYAALTQPQPLSAKEVKQQLLDTDTVLLEYALGEKRSFVFVLTSSSLDSYELPKRSEIESTAHNVYDLLTSRNRWIEGETNSQRKARVARSEMEYQKTAATLSQMILGPVAAWLQGKRLLIVADGALQYIPFAVLPVPTADPSKPEVPLVAEHEIVSLPSATVLALLRRQANDRRVESRKEVAVLADPVFDKNDSRVGRSQKRKQFAEAPAEGETVSAFSKQLTRSLGDVGLGTREAGFALPRLAFSRREADIIMSMADPGKGMEALDFQASRETALSKDLGQYRIVHFATHGLLDNEHPELSGLVLSLVNPQGKPEDGFLDLEDVYNLTLPADLVVLSACETGLGKQITGEGLVGLTRGFMYAGASRVVASLWKVDDVATAELMGRFYRGMLKEGLRPAAALRQAQMEMQKQKRWADPYYWAAFTIQGEWN